MGARLDMDKIAKALGATRRGRIEAGGGYFGAAQLVAEARARFRVPTGGGRPTDPAWTEQRLVRLTPRTLAKLERIAARLRTKSGVSVEPMQVAALLLERATERDTSGTRIAAPPE